MKPSSHISDAKVDAITLSVLWSLLISIAEEMGTALRSTSFSEAVREADDFSAALFDKRGRLVAQGNFTPGHLGSMPYVVRNVLQYFPAESLLPGDGILVNDSFLASGHYPDFFLVSPAFLHDDLIGFAVNIAHQVDVGGAAPGSQSVVNVQEAFQEGIRILPVRIFRGGDIDRDLERLILGNVRIPEKVRGDLMAQRAANNVGVERLAHVWRSYGASVLEKAIEQILDVSEQGARDLIERIPPGSYEFTDYLDDVGPGTNPVTVHVTVRIRDGSAIVDFTGSSAAVAAGINSYINYTRSYAFFAIKAFTDPLAPQNDGSLRPIEVVAEEGSFFNPRFPSPSGGRATVQIRIFEAISGALSVALPTKSMAGFSHWANPNIGGGDDGTGNPFVSYDLIMGSYGGNAMSDGAEGLSPVFNGRNIPVEVHEGVAPLRIRALQFVPDSGGAGKHRGGCAVRKETELLAPTAVLTNLTDRHTFPPYGLFGGKPGSLGETLLFRDDASIRLGSKEQVQLRCGDVVRFTTAGAGGYGDPFEREAAAVLEDVRDGLVSLEGAARDYGVIIEPDGQSVDQEATHAHRKALVGGQRKTGPV